MTRVSWTSPLRCIVSLAAVGLLATPAISQPPPPPVPASFPTLAPLPMGIQRGTTLELNLTGTNLAEPTALWTSIPGAKVTIPTDNNNGKDATKLRVVLEVPKEAPLGYHSLRLATKQGPSNLRLFCVDDLPQLVSDGKNKERTAAQLVPVPCVVAGAITAEKSDWYKINVQANQRVSFEVIGRRLGASVLDPVLTIYDPRNSNDLISNHDALGLQTDPRLTYTFKEAGEYLVEVRDETYKGGADFVYRLRIGDFPCATTPLPLAAKRGSKVQVNFAGPTVDNVPPVEVVVPADPALDTLWVAPKGANGLYGWPVALAITDLDEIVEQEPNNEPAQANRVPVPGAVSGRFLEKGDVDYFVLPLKKGRWIIDGQTQELGSPAELLLVLRDAKGAEVQRSDPQKATRLDYTAPADGDFTLSVEHLYKAFGPSETYRISVTPYEPGFDISLIHDRFGVPQGSAAVIGIGAPVRRDYNGPIEVSVVGAPGITGQANVTATAPPAPNQPAALLFISAPADAALGLHPIKVLCKATINGKVVTNYASVRGPVGAALAGLPFPPRQLFTGAVVAVTDKPPFTLTAKFDQPETVRGSAATLTVTAMRAEGFAEEIALTPLGLPANVTPVLKNIPKGMNEVKVTLTPAVAVALGSYPITLTGKGKFQNKEFNVLAPPTDLVVAAPFDLKVEPEKVAVDLGGKVKFKVTAVRKGGYMGPITLALQNPPANVTAAAASIDQGKDTVEIELTAAPTAVAGDKADVKVLGTATAAANQQNASANFTISVVKK